MPNDYLTLSQAAKTLPGRPHVSTLWRWATRGVRDRKLQTVLRGGRRFTRSLWLDDFLVPQDDAPATTSRTNRQREAAIDKAAAELESAGI